MTATNVTIEEIHRITEEIFQLRRTMSHITQYKYPKVWKTLQAQEQRFEDDLRSIEETWIK